MAELQVMVAALRWTYCENVVLGWLLCVCLIPAGSRNSCFLGLVRDLTLGDLGCGVERYGCVGHLELACFVICHRCALLGECLFGFLQQSSLCRCPGSWSRMSRGCVVVGAVGGIACVASTSAAKEFPRLGSAFLNLLAHIDNVLMTRMKVAGIVGVPCL